MCRLCLVYVGTADFDGFKKCVLHTYNHNINEVIGYLHLKRTLLHFVCLRGSVKMAKFLLKQGADPTLIDYEGKTSLDIAIEYGSPCIFTLLDFGVDVRVGKPISICYANGNGCLAKILCDRGAYLPVGNEYANSWVHKMFSFRWATRKSAILLMGVFKHLMVEKTDKNVIRQIAYHIWSCRFLGD